MSKRIIYYSQLFYNFLIVLLAFSIPINYRLSLYIVGLLTPIALLLRFYYRNFEDVLKKKVSLGIILFWIFHLVSLFYSSNLSYGLSDLFQKIMLLLIPFILIQNIIDDFHYDHIKKAFLVGLFFSSIFFILRAITLSVVVTPVGIFFKPNPVGIPWENYFFYDLFVKPHHPTYYTMYLTLGMVFLSSYLKNKLKLKGKLIVIFLIFYLVTVAFLTSSKAGIITTVIVLVVILYWLLKSKGKLVVSISLVSILSIWGYLIARNERFNNYLQQFHILATSKAIDEQVVRKSPPRIEIWKSVPDIFKGRDFIFGVGIGDVKVKLREAYKSNNANYALSEELNTHNQFLQTMVGIGLVGLLILLYILGYTALLAIRNKDITLLSFLIIISSNFMFEAVLERVFGVLFFSFFLVLITRNWDIK